jgi:hypothetical protein
MAQQRNRARGGRSQKVPVSVKQVGEAVQGLRTDLGAGLVACDVWVVADAVSLGGIDSNPAAIALFNRIADLLSKALEEAHFPPLNRYFMLDLEGGKMVVVVPAGTIRGGMLIDTTKTPLGMVLAVGLPHFRAALEQLGA